MSQIERRDNDGRTAVMAAARTGKLRLLQALVARGADLGRNDERGMNSRDAAEKFGHAEVLEYIDTVGDFRQNVVEDEEEEEEEA